MTVWKYLALAPLPDPISLQKRRKFPIFRMMTNVPLQLGKECPLPDALSIIGERWTFLILRSVIFGLVHFEELQSDLGIARNILSNRLSKLVKNGILSREVMPTDKRRVQYSLTEKGWELTPVLMALRQWAEHWEQIEPGTMVLVDNRDLKPIQNIGLHAIDDRSLALDEAVWMDRITGAVIAPLRTPKPEDKD